MTLFIRRIRADEGPLLRSIRLQALAETPMAFGSTLAEERAYPDALWHERAAGAAAGCDRATFVAERDGCWIGIVTGLARDQGAEPLLVSMFVDGNARRTGIGRALVDAVTAWARACGATRLTLWVTSDNYPAVRLYERCGFRATGGVQPLPHTPLMNECELSLAL